MFEQEKPNTDRADVSDDTEVLSDSANGESEGPEQLCLNVGTNLTHRRLDRYLQGRFRQFSRTTIQKLIKEQAVKINGSYAKPSTKLCTGDRLDVILPPPETKEIVPEEIPLNIIYEDDDLLVINKQADLIVHPARNYKKGTLVNGLVHYAKSLSSGSEEFRPGIVHRLDRNTTGVLVVAKNDTAHWRLAKQFEKRLTKKYYMAIVQGAPDLDADCINLPLGIHPHKREKMAVRLDSGKEAITFYRVLERFTGYSLLKINIKTGRTHQIRVHTSYTKHPIVGDDMYGGRAVYQWQLENKEPVPQQPLMARPALHAWQLELTHPSTEKQIVFNAPLPEDMNYLLEQLRKFRPVD